ncbi:MAG: GAF domain-containing protein [Deltaproteobacteria bacterium]|nr:GAF domain-containing protein [Deltaproteobacteria bacterium]
MRRPRVSPAAAGLSFPATTLSTDVSETLDALAELSTTLFGCEAACFLVWDHAGDVLRPGLQRGLSARAAARFAKALVHRGTSPVWDRVLGRGQPLVTLSDIAAPAQACWWHGWRAYASPLRLHQSHRLHGVLCLLYRAPITAGRIPNQAMLSPWCATAALAINYAQLAEHERAVAQGAMAVSASLAELAAPTELRTVLDRLCQRALPTIGARACAVLLRDSASGSLRLSALAGASADFIGLAATKQWPDTLGARPTARGYWTVGAELLARLLPVDPVTDDLGPALFVPILHDKLPVGVIAVVARRVARGFTKAQVQLVRNLAERAAVAVETARLYQRATLLSELATAPPYPFDRHRYLTELADRTRRVLGACRCSVWLWHAHEDRLALAGCAAPPPVPRRQQRLHPRDFAPWSPTLEPAAAGVTHLALAANSPLAKWAGEGSALLAPVRSGTRLLGAVLAGAPPGDGAYNDSHARILAGIADTAAVRLEQQELLRQAARQERELARHRERERIARDLHDTVLQTLAGINLQLTALQQLGRPPAEAELAGLQQAVREQFEMIQEFLKRLRAAEPLPIDLRGEIQRLIAEYTTQGGQPQAHVLFSGCEKLAAAVAHELVFIVREALANVQKHAHTSHLWVSLTAQGDCIDLRVRDIGRGFPRAALAGRFVRQQFLPWSIRERVAVLGGRLRLESRPGRGSTLSVRIPYRSAPRAEPRSPRAPLIRAAGRPTPRTASAARRK